MAKLEGGPRPFPSKPANEGQTRRDFLKLAGGVALGIAFGPELLSACTSVKDLEPKNENQKKMKDTLQVWENIKNNKNNNDDNFSSQEAALLTQVALLKNDQQLPVADNNFFQSRHHASVNEAVVLAVTAEVSGVGTTTIGDLFEQTRKTLSGTGDEDKSANITSIAAFTRSNITDVAYQYRDIEKNQKETSELVPILTMSQILHSSPDQANQTLNNLRAAQIVNHADQAAILYATTFTTADLEGIKVKLNQLEKDNYGDNVRGDLLIASVLSQLDLNTIEDMYHFAGKVDDMTQEAAAALVLETVLKDLPPPQQAMHTNSNTSESYTYNGGYYIFYGGTPWSPYYYGSYSPYRYYNQTSGVDTSFGNGRGGSKGRGGISGEEETEGHSGTG